MTALTRIIVGLAALFVACIVGTVCVKVALRVHQDITAGDPTMLLGRYRMDGALGYLIPGALGFIALLFVGAAILIMIPRGGSDA
jgi:hypothetical protein